MTQQDNNCMLHYLLLIVISESNVLDVLSSCGMSLDHIIIKSMHMKFPIPSVASIAYQYPAKINVSHEDDL